MREFEQNRVDKEYLALVEGIPSQKSFVVDAPIGKVVGSARAVGYQTRNPKEAVTHFEELSSLHGRTNQIRVHLASVGLPVVNDPVWPAH